MMTRCTFVFTSKLLLLLAVGTAGDASRNAVDASDEAVRSYFRSLSKASDEPHITGSINATAIPEPLTPAARHAHTARSRFIEARAALERGLLLRDAASENNAAIVEAAMAGLLHELKLCAAMTRSCPADTVKKATDLAQDWYQAGLKIIKPPAGGLVEVPLPMAVAGKADAAVAALDAVIQDANAAAPVRAGGSSKRRARVSARPRASGVDTIAAIELTRAAPQ